MKEYDNIEFEEINTGIDFEKMASKSYIDFEKEYDSLYDELLEKCHPNNFILYLRSDKEKFEIANKIYGVLLNNNSLTDDELISLRNRAVLELGIHISSRKFYNKLVYYFNPEIYTSIIPYNEKRVSKAGYYYAKILEAKNDIFALEEIEKEASGFIEMRNIELELEREKELEELEREKELEKLEREKKTIETSILLLLLIIIIIILIGIIIG